METDDIFASHAAMLATGILPGMRGEVGQILPYSLLGSTSTSASATTTSAAILDVVSLQAMRMTEVIEWALSSGAQAPYGDTSMPTIEEGYTSGSGSGGSGGFLSSFFGGGSKIATNAEATTFLAQQGQANQQQSSRHP